MKPENIRTLLENLAAGDLDIEQTKAWVETYFGGIPARPMPDVVAPAPVAIEATQRIYHEDNLARLPELREACSGLQDFSRDRRPCCRF